MTLAARGLVAGGFALAAMIAAAGCDPSATGAPSTSAEASSEASAASAVSADRAAVENTEETAVAATPEPTTSEPETGEPATSGRAAAKTFDDIKFDIEPDAPFDRSMLTDEIEQLHGKRIRIRGWILPTARTRGIRQFVLVRDNQECCFGPGAALYDCILVEMNEGKTAEFSTKSVAVEGEFAIEVFPGPGGTPLAIYRMAGESVER